MSQLKGKSIAITGGTGTLGHACVKEIIANYSDVSEVVIFSRDEIKQLEMMESFPEDGKLKMRYHLGDVRDYFRVDEVLKGVDYVIHAAAIKHVVMAEKNPNECIKTNVQGTKNIIRAAKENNLVRAVLLSTDKVINPVGIYGKTKLEAEELFREANEGNTSFGIVRMGNVVGARGSVFQAFKSQRSSGVIKVTHRDATRFCITQEMASQFILKTLISGEVDPLVPQMKVFRVLDLAKKMAPECKIEFIGLRPGDKLHEELEGESSNGTPNPKQ